MPGNNFGERFADALDTYEVVIHKYPEDAVARNGYASTLAIAQRWDEALAALPDREPVGLQDWIALHIRGMILLRRGEIEQATAIFEKGIDSCPWPSSGEYFKTALAVARLRQGDHAQAEELLAEIRLPELQLMADILRVHAFGLALTFELAAAAYQRLSEKMPASLRALAEELHRRFVLRSEPRHSDAWLSDQESLCLLAAV